MGAYQSIVGIVNVPLSYDFMFSGCSNFSAPDLPEGLNIDTNTGRIYGTVLVATSVTVTVYYNDSGNEPASTNPVIEIINISYSNFFYYASAPFILNPTIEGNSAYLYNFSISPELPVDATIDPDTGIISGSAYSTQEPTTYTVTFNYGALEDSIHSITFQLGGVFVQYHSLHVSNGDVINFNPVVTGTIGVSVGSFTLEEGDSLPAGLQLDFYTGEIYGIVSGDPGLTVRFIYFNVSGNIYSTHVCFFISSNTECLRGDMRVLTPFGYKTINTMTINDQIITNNNKTQNIKEIHNMNHTGSLYCIPKQSLSIVHPLKDVYLSENHKFYHNGRWYRPRNYCKKTILSSPVKLYHIELDDPNENIVVEGVVMESYHKK